MPLQPVSGPGEAPLRPRSGGAQSHLCVSEIVTYIRTVLFFIAGSAPLISERLLFIKTPNYPTAKSGILCSPFTLFPFLFAFNCSWWLGSCLGSCNVQLGRAPG